VLDLYTPQTRRNPFPVYDHLRKSAPVFHNPQADVWMIFDYAGVKQALNDPETFSSRAAPKGGGPLGWLIFFDPPRHTKLRGLIAMAFTPRAVASLEPRIRELSRGLLDQAIPRSRQADRLTYRVTPSGRPKPSSATGGTPGASVDPGTRAG
jgi:cytochrome P450